jgi:hypothetical protein
MTLLIEPADVLARCAYAEIDGPHAGFYGEGSEVEALRGKRRDGLSFHDLGHSDRAYLEQMCRSVRHPLMKYLDGVQQFVLRSVDRVALGHLLVPPEVEFSERHMSFAQYVSKPHNDENDARAIQSAPGSYKLADDPLTIGRRKLLLDGYHRAVAFWWFAGPGATIDAYAPDPFQSVD